MKTLSIILIIITFFHHSSSLEQGTGVPVNFTQNQERSQTMDSFFDKLFETYVAHDPQRLTKLAIREAKGLKCHNADLTDVSPKAIMKDLERKKEDLKHLNTHQLEDLSQDQKTSYQVFSWMLKHDIDGEQFLFHEYRINHLDSILTRLAVLLTQFHTLETIEDVEHYLSRLNKIPEQINQTIEFLDLQQTKNIYLPRFALEKVIKTIQNLTSSEIPIIFSIPILLEI